MSKAPPPPTMLTAKPEEVLRRLAGKQPVDLLVLEPADVLRFEKLAAAALNERNDEGAEAAAELVVAHDPKRAHAWVILGVARCRMKNFTHAVPCFLKALELQPGDIATWVDLGECYISMLDFIHAAQALKQALLLDPNAQHPAGRRARAIVGRTVSRLKKA